MYQKSMITVCMATFNGAKYISEQIESILSQLHPQDELIISDDGSSDGTLEIIRNFNDPRLKLIHSGKKNIIKNFENALLKAQGDVIFLSDQDDIWLPEKVSICLSALEQGADLVVSDCTLIDSHKNTLHDSFFSIHPPNKGFTQNLIKNSFMGCCMVFKKEILTYALPFPSPIPMHDSWIGLITLLFGGKVTFLNDKLILYRRHDHVLSSTGQKSSSSLIKKISDRYCLLKALLMRRLERLKTL